MFIEPKERNMTERKPTDFEIKVLKMIARYNAVISGSKSVQYSAAAGRLEKAGYVGRARNWFVTQKGKDYLKSIGA